MGQSTREARRVLRGWPTGFHGPKQRLLYANRASSHRTKHNFGSRLLPMITFIASREAA